MTPDAFLRDVFRPAQKWAAAQGIPQSPASDQFLMTVAGQESNWTHRAQVLNGGGKGPARGFWQFERGGGVKGVLAHPASKAKALALCKTCLLAPTPEAVWPALESYDGLAYGFARLLLLTDPQAIPTKPDAAWDCYQRCWRPGKPHPDVWPGKWLLASKALAA